MTRTSAYQDRRRIVRLIEAALVLGIPFLTVRGESALRFDVPTLTLHVLGARLWMDEFFIVLIACLALTFLLITVTVLWGRIWCGWLCPQTVLVDLTSFMVRRYGGVGTALTILGMAPVSAIVSASLLWYFVEPAEFFGRLAEGRLGPVLGWSWAVLGIAAFLNFAFLRRGFCTTVCPYAKLQGALFDERTLIIGMDPARREECMHCDACVRTCPVRIDVRKGLDAACVNCAECIDACAERMGQGSRSSLIEYRYGAAGEKATFLRKGVLIPGVATLVLSAMLAVLVVNREPIDLVIAADPALTPRRTSEMNPINYYLLSFTNRSRKDQVLALRATGSAGAYAIVPAEVSIGKDEHLAIRAMVTTQSRGQERPDSIVIAASSKADRSLMLSRQVPFQHSW